MSGKRCIIIDRFVFVLTHYINTFFHKEETIAYHERRLNETFFFSCDILMVLIYFLSKCLTFHKHKLVLNSKINY